MAYIHLGHSRTLIVARNSTRDLGNGSAIAPRRNAMNHNLQCCTSKLISNAKAPLLPAVDVCGDYAYALEIEIRPLPDTLNLVETCARAVAGDDLIPKLLIHYDLPRPCLCRQAKGQVDIRTVDVVLALQERQLARMARYHSDSHVWEGGIGLIYD